MAEYKTEKSAAELDAQKVEKRWRRKESMMVALVAGAFMFGGLFMASGTVGVLLGAGCAIAGYLFLRQLKKTIRREA